MSHKINSATAQKLFKLAGVIREAAPWNRLVEKDIFGIKDPKSGEVSVVSTIGNAGQVYAIQRYLPEEGIRFWNDYFKNNTVPKDIYTNQRMLECEFCSMDDLPEEDIDFHSEYGPDNIFLDDVAVFRSYRPRYHPWFLEQAEAEKLIQTLELYPAFLHYIKSTGGGGFNPFASPFEIPDIPVFHLKEGGKEDDLNAWEIKKQVFPRAAEEEPSVVERDEIFLNRHQSCKQVDASWEIAAYILSEPIMEEGDERPCYPAVSLCIDPDVQIEPTVCVESPEVSLPMLMRKTFSEAVDRYGYLPKVLNVATDLGVGIFQGFAKSYGITVKKCDELEAINAVAPALIQALSGQMSPDLMEKLSDPDFDPEDLDEEMMRALGISADDLK